MVFNKRIAFNKGILLLKGSNILKTIQNKKHKQKKDEYSIY